MTRPSKPSRHLAGAAFIAAATVLIVPTALAQTREPAPKEAPRAPESKQPERQLPQAEATPPAPGPARPQSPLDKVPQTAEEKARALADLYAHLATAEDEAQAKRYADRIERLWVLSGSDTVNLLMERASAAIQEKKAGLARKLLDAAIDLAPDYAEAFNRRAFLHFSQNDFQSAVGDLRRVLALDPNHFKALEGLAQVWRETGDKRGAFRVMQQLMGVHPFAPGAKAIHDELKREVDGQGI